MIELIAEGSSPTHRWKIPLEPERTYILGRDHPGPLAVPWDPQISRRHAELTLNNGIVDVVPVPYARNAIFFRGQAVTHCSLRAGEHFVIGSTTFHLGDFSPEGDIGAKPIGELTFSRQELKAFRFRDPDHRIEVLSHLPELIAGAQTDAELFPRLVNFLLTGVPQAEAAAIVAGTDPPRILYWDRRRQTAGELRPSKRLIRESMETQQSVLFSWDTAQEESADYTGVRDFDWAFCTPVQCPATQDWGLYLAGRRDHEFRPAEETVRVAGAQLQGDVKFVELVSEIVSAVWRLRQLERQQSGLRQFFAPAVLTAVGDSLDTDLLAPREADVTILFCDLRGFSRFVEVSQDDLLEVLDRVSQALEVMTHHILSHGGGIGDFLGDAAMGFWGWPVASPDAALDACKAALGIRAAFRRAAARPQHPLANFEMGIGIAQGRAVAGKIGTADHVKVTVFGPAVNLANRLESMTKSLRVPILLDENVARIARERLSPNNGRIRKLARVLPYGIETPLTVSELLPAYEDEPLLSDGQLQQYEKAVDHFLAGKWDAAYNALHDLPAEDRAQDFLALQIAQHNRMPPPGWDGVVRLSTK